MGFNSGFKGLITIPQMLTTRLLTGTAAVTWWPMSLQPYPDEAGSRFLRNVGSIYHTARFSTLHILRLVAPTD